MKKTVYHPRVMKQRFICVLLACMFLISLIGCASKMDISDSDGLRNDTSNISTAFKTETSRITTGSSNLTKNISSTISSVKSSFRNTVDSKSITTFSTSTSETFLGLPLKPYVRPTDLDYDLSPLPLYQPLSFITRKGDKLYNGSSEFRFISANAPTILNCTPFEQEDLVRSIAQMGGQVVRSYTFTVKWSKTNPADLQYTHILGKSNYNELAFRRMDNLLALCHKYGVRLIIPFVDPYVYVGGMPAFNEMFGKNPYQDNPVKAAATFYSTPEIKEEFFNFVRYVLNRKNTITGVYYKDDPAIMAWESGNEMPYYNDAAPYYDKWMRELGQLIKSIDKNHLLIDGAAFGNRSAALSDHNIDIVNNHYYPHTASNPFEAECRNMRNFSNGKKACIIGEFGFITTDKVKKLYEEVIANGTSGVLFWSLRPHSEGGSFVQHSENEVYKSYHWPGFPEQDSFDARNMLRLTYIMAHQIQGKKPRLIEKPDVPSIITPIKDPQMSIIWRGSTGAYGYDIQRAEHKDGPWTTIGVDISDDYDKVAILFADKSKGLKAGKTYWYRIRAKSNGGFSDWSEPVPTVVKRDS